MNEIEETRTFPVTDTDGADNHTVSREPTEKKVAKSYIFYCMMTMTVVLFTLTFAATELFGMFFSDVNPEKYLMSRVFGMKGSENMSFQELLLSQSFAGLVKNTTAVTVPPVITEKPSDATVTTPKQPATQTPAVTTVPTTVKPGPQTTPVVIPDGWYPISEMDLSLPSFGLDYINNTSSASPNLDLLGSAVLSTNVAGVYPVGSPLVLIIHTHGTEAYTAEGAVAYNPSEELARSDDTKKNVVAVGKRISDILNEKGITTLHCEIMHDCESYGGSYTRSAETIKKYLREYPSIRYVIDVHRDAITDSSGALIKPVCETERGKCAQIMAVVGTGESSTACPGYCDNLAMAQVLRQKLNGINKSFCRPACLRPSAYNQQYSAYSVLLEIGAAGNTLAEAITAAGYTGEALAEIIHGK